MQAGARRRGVVVEMVEHEGHVRPAVAAERGLFHLHHRATFVGDLFPADRVGIPEVVDRPDGETEMARRMVFGPLQEDEALLHVVADDLHRIAVAGFEVLVGVESQPDRDRRRPVGRAVGEGLRCRVFGARRPFLGKDEAAAEFAVGREFYFWPGRRWRHLSAYADAADRIVRGE